MVKHRIPIPEFGLGQAWVKFGTQYHIAQPAIYQHWHPSYLGDDPLAGTPSGGREGSLAALSVIWRRQTTDFDARCALPGMRMG